MHAVSSQEVKLHIAPGIPLRAGSTTDGEPSRAQQPSSRPHRALAVSPLQHCCQVFALLQAGALEDAHPLGAELHTSAVHWPEVHCLDRGQAGWGDAPEGGCFALKACYQACYVGAQLGQTPQRHVVIKVFSSPAGKAKTNSSLLREDAWNIGGQPDGDSRQMWSCRPSSNED